ATMILHWNGTAWKTVTSPNPSSTADWLSAVSAVSSSDAWAVGYYFASSGDKTLTLHWNGTAWSKVTSPSPSTYNFLSGVSARASSDAWAVGYSCPCGGGSVTGGILLHWNGTAWVVT